ncbi:MAG: PAS domain S-box protein, partial [Deltaproteobacteria bacterium]
YAVEWELRYPDGRMMPFEGWPMSRAIRGDYVSDFEVHLLKVKSGYRWVGNYTTIPVGNSAGKVMYIVMTIIDITERKLSEEALKRSQRLLEDTQILGKVGGWEFDIDTRQQTWTEEVYRIHELDLSHNINIAEGVNFYTPVSRPIIERAVQRAIESGEPFDVELEIITAKGNLRCVHAIGKVDSARRKVSGFFQDITERKRTEEALRENKAKLQLTIDEAPICIATVGMDKRFLTCNVSFCTFLGYSEDELKQKTIADITLPEDSAIGMADMRAIVKGEMKTSIVQKRYVRKDGKVVWGEICINLVRNNQGQPMYFLPIIQDITQRKLAEGEILKLNAELEARVLERTASLLAANKELDAFSYSVSHDLRAPLRGIDGWSAALIEDAGEKLNDKEKQYLARVRSETQKLGELIDALLQLSRINNSGMNKQAIDLSSMAEKISAGLKERFPHRNVEVMIQPGIIVNGDAKLLESALTNLLDNAWKFSGTREQSRIEFGSTATDNKRVYYVRDNGVGFDMQYAGKLFGTFQRLHKISEFPGHGIGLATVQRIVHRHGGEIWAEAKVNQGATFYFTL